MFIFATISATLQPSAITGLCTVLVAGAKPSGIFRSNSVKRQNFFFFFPFFFAYSCRDLILHLSFLFECETARFTSYFSSLSAETYIAPPGSSVSSPSLLKRVVVCDVLKTLWNEFKERRAWRVVAFVCCGGGGWGEAGVRSLRRALFFISAMGTESLTTKN